jgi:excinuclease ABC subunit C
MIVCENGKFNRSEYRSFNIKTVSGTDDYASMAEALERRFTHLLSEDSPSFSKYPDLILLDGGRSHVSVVKRVAERMGVDVPIFGMVKDEYHKTRALCNESEEINIAKMKSVFMLIYGIQEEVHRFSVGKMTNAKRKSYKRSSLEKIEGIGQAKAAKLLREFGGLAALHAASEEKIAAVKGISRRDAQNIVAYFNKTREKK